MPAFTTKITVEAKEYTRNGLEAERVAEWCDGRQTDEGCVIETPKGEVLVPYGDWIIKYPNGALESCNRAQFNANYTRA